MFTKTRKLLLFISKLLRILVFGELLNLLNMIIFNIIIIIIIIIINRKQFTQQY